MGLEWSLSGLRKNSSLSGTTASAAVNFTPGMQDGSKASHNIKEHFVVTTQDGHIFHFTVEGSIVRHGARIPADPVMVSISNVITLLSFIKMVPNIAS